MQQLYINSFDFTDKILFTLAIVILFTCLLYWSSIKLGKPMIIGGIISGLIISHVNLPVKYFDIERCAVIGNFGMVLFMMLIGTEFNFKRLLVNKSNIALPILLTIIPFVLGFTLLPIFIHFQLLDGYAISHRWLIAVFIGIAVSMSTFSILIMFVNNTKLSYTKIGKLAIFCATFEEATFWMVFAIILTFFQKNAELSLSPLSILAGYVIFVLFILPYLIRYMVNKITSEVIMLGFIVGGCLLSAVLADFVNLHQIFGGFIFGALLPKDNILIRKFREYLLEFIIIILLPIYFVKTGIDASANLSFDYITIVISLIFILVSLLGKYGAAFLAGKMWSFTNKEVIILGSLLSIRGTMEVAILNVGKEVGLIQSKLYGGLVIMTLVTTWIATTVSLYVNKNKKTAEL
jgi:Kef-type K+ transport system membrane component KefB